MSVDVNEGQSQTQFAVAKSARVTPLSNLGREAEVLSRVLKITQRGMVKRRRSYGSISEAVIVSLTLSHTLQRFDPFSKD